MFRPLEAPDRLFLAWAEIAGWAFGRVDVEEAGEPTQTATWFRGYEWQVTLCLGCDWHIGWRYPAAADPPLFYGLIKRRLTSSPKA